MPPGSSPIFPHTKPTRQDTLFYLDPPYLPSVRSEWKGRSGESAYANELTCVDHEALLKRILGLDGMVAISGYHSDLYDDYLSGWAYAEKQTHATANRNPRTEVLWLSPNLRSARLPLLNPIVSTETLPKKEYTACP